MDSKSKGKERDAGNWPYIGYSRVRDYHASTLGTRTYSGLDSGVVNHGAGVCGEHTHGRADVEGESEGGKDRKRGRNVWSSVALLEINSMDERER